MNLFDIGIYAGEWEKIEYLTQKMHYA